MVKTILLEEILKNAVFIKIILLQGRLSKQDCCLQRNCRNSAGILAVLFDSKLEIVKEL